MSSLQSSLNICNSLIFYDSFFLEQIKILLSDNMDFIVKTNIILYLTTNFKNFLKVKNKLDILLYLSTL